MLVEVGGRTVLVVSALDPGRILHVGYAFVDDHGDRFDLGPWQRLTYGPSLYAASTFADAEGEPGLVAWLREVGDVESGWMGAHSLPVRVRTSGDRLVAAPPPALAARRAGRVMEGLLPRSPTWNGPRCPVTSWWRRGGVVWTRWARRWRSPSTPYATSFPGPASRCGWCRRSCPGGVRRLSAGGRARPGHRTRRGAERLDGPGDGVPVDRWLRCEAFTAEPRNQRWVRRVVSRLVASAPRTSTTECSAVGWGGCGGCANGRSGSSSRPAPATSRSRSLDPGRRCCVLPRVFCGATGARDRMPWPPSSTTSHSPAPLAAGGVRGLRALQVLAPLHQAIGANLGSAPAAWLYDRLTDPASRPRASGTSNADPDGDLTMARDFDLGITGPPLSISMTSSPPVWSSWSAGAGLGASCSPASPGGRRSLLGGAWLADPLAAARERRCGRTATPTRCARRQRHADYAYRLAVDPPAGQGAAALRPGRLDDRPLHRPPAAAVRPAVRGDPAARAPVLWSLAAGRRPPTSSSSGRWPTPPPPARSTSAQVVVFAQAAVGASLIAFGGLNWALDGAAAPVAAVAAARGRRWAGRRAGRRRRSAGRRPAGARDPLPRRHVRLPGRPRRCSTASTSPSRPGRRWPSSARTAPARPRWPSCCAASTTRRPARSRSTASTCATSTSTLARAGHRGVPGLHPLRAAAARQRRARAARPTTTCGPRSPPPARRDLAGLDTMLAARLRRRHRPVGRPVAARRAGPGAVRRAARAPASCCSTSPPPSSTSAARPRSSSASSPRPGDCTTILISHRFSTVRHADRICVLEHGRVVELGTHDELMAQGGRYRTMFDLQAQRFAAAEDEEGVTYDVLG